MATQLQLLPHEYYQQAADCLKVMAHPVRLKIVSVLMEGRFTVNEIAEFCECLPNRTCEHLRLMKGHGMLTSEREGREVYYTINTPQLPALLECIARHCPDPKS